MILHSPVIADLIDNDDSPPGKPVVAEVLRIGVTYVLVSHDLVAVLCGEPIRVAGHGGLV